MGVSKHAAIVPVTAELADEAATQRANVDNLTTKYLDAIAKVGADIEDERAAWHEWRGQGIGGSDIAKILGLSRYGSPWSVWADKVGLTTRTESTERQRIGTDLEPVLDGLFTRRTGLHVHGQQTWCIDTDAPWRRCTVDGFAYKTATPANPAHSRFGEALGTVQHKTDYRRAWPDGIPADIRAQCVWEMGVTKLPHAWLSVMHGGFAYEVYEISWDTAALDDWDYMCDQADQFWHAHVVAGVAPEIDGSDATRDALKDAYPEEEPGARAEVDPADLAQLHEWRTAATRTKARVQEYSNRIAAALADAEIGTVEGRAVITARAQTRRQTCKACGHVEESAPYRVIRDAPKKLADLPPVPCDDVQPEWHGGTVRCTKPHGHDGAHRDDDGAVWAFPALPTGDDDDA